MQKEKEEEEIMAKVTVLSIHHDLLINNLPTLLTLRELTTLGTTHYSKPEVKMHYHDFTNDYIG